uniref:Uncharacterized protein n=1 Tax=Picea glauca TaxID=3330 RepID=A0A101LV78_PICGL|nr:hypothetical protein ABT39_MTgene2082 [Picea glauca]QHR88492.1 hypothetical protein Q903MT_gene2506 [Picea sitchensis]
MRLLYLDTWLGSRARLETVIDRRSSQRVIANSQSEPVVTDRQEVVPVQQKVIK